MLNYLMLFVYTFEEHFMSFRSLSYNVNTDHILAFSAVDSQEADEFGIANGEVLKFSSNRLK